MNELQKKIVKWHKSTFPNATEEAILDKLDEELQEAYCAKTFEELCEEIADVVIVAFSLLDRRGVSLKDVINNKLEINKKRDWGEETENGDRPRNR